jgi:hypothetical protein
MVGAAYPRVAVVLGRAGRVEATDRFDVLHDTHGNPSFRIDGVPAAARIAACRKSISRS